MSGDPGDFENLVDYDYQRAKIQVVLKTSDPDHHYELYETAKDYLSKALPAGATADFGGDIILWLAKVDYIIKGKIQNIVLALGLIIVTCSLAYRTLNSGMLAVLPIAFGVVLTFGFMSLLGLRLDMPTSIITGIAVGIGIDFSIHYLSKLRATMKATANIEQSLEMTACTSGKAVVFDTFTNMLGFSMLIMSAFQPVQIFGYLVSFTMLIMGASVIVLLPAIAVWLKPKFIFGHTPENEAFEGLPQQG
jgi:predicted RND superfamily exporter protein